MLFWGRSGVSSQFQGLLSVSAGFTIHQVVHYTHMALDPFLAHLSGWELQEVKSPSLFISLTTCRPYFLTPVYLLSLSSMFNHMHNCTHAFDICVSCIM
jgi:hypothetical protein